MGKLIKMVVLVTMLTTSIGLAKWYGTVVRDDTGLPAVNARVYAYSAQGSSNWVYTDSSGYWEMDSCPPANMKNGRYYSYIWAEKYYEEGKWGNYISGGIYYEWPDVNKGEIRIKFPPPNPNPD